MLETGQTLLSLLPTDGFLYPAVYAFVVYGGRYVVFAGIAFFLADPSRPKPRGRPHISPPTDFDVTWNIRRELGHSFLTLLIVTLVHMLLYGFGLIQASQVYLDFAQYPAWWFWVSIPVMLLLHDSLFYWLHRAIHLKPLYAKVHLLHHQSVYPTAFAAYSFSWREGIVDTLSVVAVLYIIPIHPAAFLIFQTIVTAYSVYLHCGREFYPRTARYDWLVKWLNTSSLHAVHHHEGKGNYSFYFTFWDHAMATLQTRRP